MEIDPVVVELAGQYFNFVEDAQMRVHIEDG